MPFAHSNEESQRDSGLQPRVARHELPWESGTQLHNPNGVAARRARTAATPLGLIPVRVPTQGSSCLATLGWRTQPRWGCRAFGSTGCKPRFATRQNTRKALESVGSRVWSSAFTRFRRRATTGPRKRGTPNAVPRGSKDFLDSLLGLDRKAGGFVSDCITSSHLPKAPDTVLSKTSLTGYYLIP